MLCILQFEQRNRQTKKFEDIETLLKTRNVVVFTQHAAASHLLRNHPVLHEHLAMVLFEELHLGNSTYKCISSNCKREFRQQLQYIGDCCSIPGVVLCGFGSRLSVCNMLNNTTVSTLHLFRIPKLF